MERRDTSIRERARNLSHTCLHPSWPSPVRRQRKRPERGGAWAARARKRAARRLSALHVSLSMRRRLCRLGLLNSGQRVVAALCGDPGGACLNFCVRGALRLFHGGGRRLRRTDRRGGKVGLHIARPSWRIDLRRKEHCELNRDGREARRNCGLSDPHGSVRRHRSGCAQVERHDADKRLRRQRSLGP